MEKSPQICGHDKWMVWDLKDVKKFFSKIVIKVNLFRK